MKRRWSIAAAILLLVTAVYFIHMFLIPYRDDVRSKALVFEPTSVQRDMWRLETALKEVLGKQYVSFYVMDEETGETAYRCPDLYALMELESITWAEDAGYDIAVYLRSGERKRYEFGKGSWRSAD